MTREDSSERSVRIAPLSCGHLAKAGRAFQTEGIGVKPKAGTSLADVKKTKNASEVQVE